MHQAFIRTFQWAAVFMLTFVFYAASGQREFVPGLVVTNAGDTLHGLIEQREKDQDITPASITFKASEDASPTLYSVDDISYFSLAGGLSCRRYTVGISMDPVQLRKVMGYTIPQPVIKPVFLEILQEGKEISLFAYQDELKPRFYVLDDEHDEPQELVYRIIKLGANYREGFQFRDELSFLANRAGVLDDELRFRISQCTYTREPIVAIVSVINGMRPPKPKTKSASSGPIVGVGIGLASLKYFKGTEYAKNASSSGTVNWYVSMGYDLATNRQVGALVFRGQLVYFRDEFTTTTYDYRFSGKLDIRHHFVQNNFGLVASAVYYVVNEPKLRLYFGAGIQYNHSTYDNSLVWTRTTGNNVTPILLVNPDDAIPKSNWACFPVRAGLVLSRKFELGLVDGIIPTQLSRLTFPYKYGLNTFRLEANYHL